MGEKGGLGLRGSCGLCADVRVTRVDASYSLLWCGCVSHGTVTSFY